MARTNDRRWTGLVALVLVALAGWPVLGQTASPVSRVITLSPDWLVTASSPGQPGGRLVTALRAEPRTWNPVMAVDNPSRDVIRRLHADLVSINRETQRTELALARAVERSPDGRRFVVRLRRGITFSDGHPFDADDVVFSFAVYQDASVASPQRDLLEVHGKPIEVRKIDAHAVEITCAEPYGPGERLFDSVAMLPRHILEPEYRRGTLAKAWGLGIEPTSVVGLGPYRLKAYVPGQAIVLERNPHYWKRDRRAVQLPYLEELRFVFVPNEDAQALRFEAGEIDVADRLGAEQFDRLLRNQAGALDLRDLGAGLDYTFLMFNLNELRPTAPESLKRRQRWFADVAFRRAVSLAIDRAAMARLVYQNRATPLWWHVPSSNQFWFNSRLSKGVRSIPRARELLRSAGFSWTSSGALMDKTGAEISFSILTSSTNAQRAQMATMLQADLKGIGITASIVSLEFGSMLDRVMRAHDYDAAIMGLGSGDVDPGGQVNTWRSSGGTHLWRLGAPPATPAEVEIDRLLDEQMATTDLRTRKTKFDRIQTLVASEVPIVTLVGPNVLVGAKRALGNVKPGIIDHHLLWNADELYWRDRTQASR